MPASIAFPISELGPPIVGSLWGIIFYKEVKGLRNFAFLFSGITLAITGAVLIGLSFWFVITKIIFYQLIKNDWKLKVYVRKIVHLKMLISLAKRIIFYKLKLKIRWWHL